MKSSVLLAAALAGVSQAQVNTWGQCGGVGYTGGTSCVGGTTCSTLNPYYAQCIPGSSPQTTTTSAQGQKTTTTSSSAKTTTTSSKTTTTSSKTTTSSSTTTTSSQGTQSTGTGLTPVPGGASGSGVTTRYWDCCKPSCAWPGKATVSNPVLTCDANQNVISDSNTVSACDGGTSYMCANQTPIQISSNIAYGFAAVNIAGGSEATWCCACYQLTFTSGPGEGNIYVVQATNTGGDLGSNQFDLAFPGGGFGVFDGCTTEYPSTPTSNWGQQYGGISTESQCSGLPTVLQPGCDFRFTWFEGADNPNVNFIEVECPAQLTALSGCTRLTN